MAEETGESVWAARLGSRSAAFRPPRAPSLRAGSRRSALPGGRACASLFATVLLGLISAAAISIPAAESAPAGTNAPSLDPHLEPMRPLLNKTWRGPFKGSRPDKPVVDVMRAERALNGRAIRSLHSINEGSYGGETIYMWSEQKKAVTYHYFTTAGFMTTGTLRFDDGKWVTARVCLRQFRRHDRSEGRVRVSA